MDEGGEVLLSFPGGEELFDALERHGEMPLPPYIARDAGATASDDEDYQTVYAARRCRGGADRWASFYRPADGCGPEYRCPVRHCDAACGAGTFLPVKVDRIADHRMREWGWIDTPTADTINSARCRWPGDRGRHNVAPLA